MSDRVQIRISYGNGFVRAEAEHVGTDADGIELYRVWRQGMAPGEPERVDVLRLRQREDGVGFDFVGTADPSRPGIAYLTIASVCLGIPACTAFRDQVLEHGCVVEHQSLSGDAIYLVVTHPTNVPVHEWHAEMLRTTIGVSPDEMPAYLRRQVLEKERRRARRRTRLAILDSLRNTLGIGLRIASVLAILGMGVGIVGGVGMLLFSAAPSDRPRMAAMGMLIALAPIVLSREMWPILAACALAGLAAVGLVSEPTPSYGGAAALGAVYAVFVGVMAVLIGIFSMFANNSRVMGQVVFGLALPLFASALAAAVLAIGSAAAVASAAATAGSGGGLGDVARVVAAVVTALLLLGPVGATLVNAGAIVFGKAWRANPTLAIGALLTLPLQAFRPKVLRRIGIPIALLWGLAWVLR